MTYRGATDETTVRMTALAVLSRAAVIADKSVTFTVAK